MQTKRGELWSEVKDFQQQLEINNYGEYHHTSYRWKGGLQIIRKCGAGGSDRFEDAGTSTSNN